MIPRFAIPILLGLLAIGAAAQDASSPVVKKSQQGICHERGSGNYAQTQHFEPYDSMETCLASGGRRPVGLPPVKKSRQGICHERGLGAYEQTRDFDAYDSMQACLASGGRAAANAPSLESRAREASRAPGANEWLKKGGLIAGLLALVGVILRGPLKQWLRRRAQS